MSDHLLEQLNAGIQAWTDGDLPALEAVLDERVRLIWAEPGGLDCTGRDQVLDFLGRNRPGNLAGRGGRLTRVADNIFVLSADSEASPQIANAVRITLAQSTVVLVQLFHSRESAMRGTDPVHDAAVAAIHEGRVAALQHLLAAEPALALVRLPGYGDRTLLHVATDWPGHFPNVAATIGALVAAGADVNAPSIGDHTETPLHWAASSDDIEALDALLDAGADIEARGAVIGGGTPLSDATAFGQWSAARRLIERGAQPQLWEAAALGLLSLLQQKIASSRPGPDDITQSFWCACHGSQLETAAYLLALGAEVNWVGYDELTPLDAARRSGGTAVASWLETKGAVSAG